MKGTRIWVALVAVATLGCGHSDRLAQENYLVRAIKATHRSPHRIRQDLEKIFLSSEAMGILATGPEEHCVFGESELAKLNPPRELEGFHRLSADRLKNLNRLQDEAMRAMTAYQKQYNASADRSVPIGSMDAQLDEASRRVLEAIDKVDAAETALYDGQQDEIEKAGISLASYESIVNTCTGQSKTNGQSSDSEQTGR